MELIQNIYGIGMLVAAFAVVYAFRNDRDLGPLEILLMAMFCGFGWPAMLLIVGYFSIHKRLAKRDRDRGGTQ